MVIGTQRRESSLPIGIFGTKNFIHILRGWSSRPQELHPTDRHIRGETGLAVYLILP